MPVFRVEKNKDYTTISNYHLRDRRLSLKAKGLLSIMLSLPDDWDYSLEGLVSISLESERAIKSALKELKNAGYLVIVKLFPESGKRNKIEYIYNIYEKSQEVQNVPLQNVSLQDVDVHDVELQNEGQLNTNNKITNNKVLNNKILNNKYNTPSPIANTIFEEIESNFGRTLSPYEIEEIKNWEDTELTRYAIKKAVLNNKFSIQYISKILYSWKKENIRTVQEAQRDEEEFQNKKKSNYTRTRYKSERERWEETKKKFLEGDGND